jgi:hypothetical protein
MMRVWTGWTSVRKVKERRGRPTISCKPLTLEEKHELVKFTRLAALPDLSPGEAALALTMKRSAIAELKLSQKALDYAKPHEDPEVERALALYRLFRLPLPPV